MWFRLLDGIKSIKCKQFSWKYVERTVHQKMTLCLCRQQVLGKAARANTQGPHRMARSQSFPPPRATCSKLGPLSCSHPLQTGKGAGCPPGPLGPLRAREDSSGPACGNNRAQVAPRASPQLQGCSKDSAPPGLGRGAEAANGKPQARRKGAVHTPEPEPSKAGPGLHSTRAYQAPALPLTSL